MDEQSTIATLVVAIVLTLVAVLGESARKRSPFAWHAYLPWRPLSLAGVAVALFAGAHLLTLLRAG